jgi:tyrosyl-tRNA synthetase
MVLPILEGLDGEKKMSKSLGNYVGLTESASEMFGKLMSISDELMKKYYPLLLRSELDPGAHPLQAKKHLAATIVETYHSKTAADRTLEDWNARFSEKRLEGADLPAFASHQADVVSIVVSAYASAFGITKSRADARRLIEQGSVQLKGEKLRDPKTVVALESGQILRLDKTHAVRIA